MDVVKGNLWIISTDYHLLDCDQMVMGLTPVMSTVSHS
jgi:hypothetical protein